MILYSCIRTSENVTRLPTESKCFFSQLASPVDRCRVEWKTHLKGPTLSIKNCLGLSKVSFLSRKLPGESNERAEFYVQKLGLLELPHSNSSVTSERLAIEIAQNVYRNTVCLLNSNFDKAPPRKVVAKHLRHSRTFLCYC